MFGFAKKSELKEALRRIDSLEVKNAQLNWRLEHKPKYEVGKKYPEGDCVGIRVEIIDYIFNGVGFRYVYTFKKAGCTLTLIGC